MGKFTYGSPSITAEFDDRVLAHLKVVIASKLRRGESFLFSWEHAGESGAGYSSVWLHPAIPLRFEFSASEVPDLNRSWLEAMMVSSNSVGGLRIMPEPSPGETSNDSPRVGHESKSVRSPKG